MNVVATQSGMLVEVQGTAEGDPFGRDAMDQMLDVALRGIDELLAGQTGAIEAARAGDSGAVAETL